MLHRDLSVVDAGSLIVVYIEGVFTLSYSVGLRPPVGINNVRKNAAPVVYS